MEEKIEKVYEKTTDWWARHNVTTRTVIMTILFLLVGTVILSWLDKDIKHFDKIVEVLSDNLLWLTAIVIAGVNGASIIIEKILQYRKGNKND